MSRILSNIAGIIIALVSLPLFAGEGLEVRDQRLYLNGQTYKIIESNSPENRLQFLDYDQLDYLHSAGVNTIYASLNHNEPQAGTVFNLYVDNDKTLGIDVVKSQRVLEYLEYWHSLSPARISHLLLSEQETHFYHDEQEEREYIKYVVGLLGHLNIIWDREEYPDDKLLTFTARSQYLRSIDSKNLIAIHNEPNERPWRYLSPDVLDLVSIQAPLQNAEREMEDAHDAGFAVYASEIMPYWDGFQPEDIDLALEWYSVAPQVSSGAGFYYGLVDQSYPDQEPYTGLYRAITNPDINTVLNNLNEMYWIESDGIPPFSSPVHREPMEMIAIDDNTFGYIETRYPLRGLDSGVYRLMITMNKTASTARVRINNIDQRLIQMLVINTAGEKIIERELVFKSEGKDFVISVDLLEFNKPDSYLEVLDIQIEEISK